MMYRKKRNKLKIVLFILIPIVLLAIIYRLDLKSYILGDNLKVLSSEESTFFIEEDKDNALNIKKLSSLDDNKGVMIFTVDNSKVDIEDISKKFSGENIVGRIRRDTDSFDGYSSDRKIVGSILKDTKVEILTHYNSSWYYVKELESDLAMWVSEDMLWFPYTPKTKKDILTDEEIEVFINSSSIVSESENMLYVDIMRQSIYVFKNYSDKWDLIKTIKCMSGSSRNSILKGEFKVSKKDEFVLFKSEKSIYRYLTKINNGFDIRSMPEFTSKQEEGIEKDEIVRSSKGNLWLSEIDAKWVYENIELNSTVIIK